MPAKRLSRNRHYLTDGKAALSMYVIKYNELGILKAQALINDVNYQYQ